MSTIAQIIPSLELGGAERVVENLALGLSKKKQDVIVYSLYDNETPISINLQQNNIKVRFLHKKPGFDISMIFRLRKQLKEDGVDYIHSHLYALPYVVLANGFVRKDRKVFQTIHTVPLQEYGKWSLRFNRYLYKSKKVYPVSISPEIQRLSMELFDLNSEAIPMIFNGIDTSAFRNERNYLLQSPAILVNVASFKEQKNHEYLLQEFASLLKAEMNVKLVLIGDGELRDKSEKMATYLNISENVEFLGSRTDIAELLKSSDVFLLPSKLEGMPISLIEAMSSGLPVIVSAVGGVIDMIRDNENGVFTSLEKNALSEQINSILENISLRKKIGRQAVLDSQHYSLENMVESYMRIYGVE